jgi:hypothetical protein
MKTGMVLLLCALLAACTAAPVTQRDERFFGDRLFVPPTRRISADDVFALSAEMRRYLDREIAELARVKGRPRALFDALYDKGQLRLEYDTEMTRNAAEAFAARSGNCLSLVIMTAAFAKELGLAVEYQKVYVNDAWARAGDVYLAIGHVNLTLGRRRTDEAPVAHRVGGRPHETDAMTIDFLPPKDLRTVRSQPIGEEIVVAMYLNNRAGEALALGQLDDAYWWAREAIVQAPGFLVPYNTLGAIYQRHGNPAEARRVLAHVLEREPGNTQAMANLVPVLAGLGQVEEAQRLAAVQSLQARNGGAAGGRRAGRQGRLRARGRPRPRLPRVPVLAGGRLPRHRRCRGGAQAPDARDAEQHDAARPRPVCGEARPDRRMASAGAGILRQPRGRGFTSRRERAALTASPGPRCSVTMALGRETEPRPNHTTPGRPMERQLRQGTRTWPQPLN